MDAFLAISPASVCSVGANSSSTCFTRCATAAPACSSLTMSCSFMGSKLPVTSGGKAPYQEHIKFVSVRAANDAASKIAQAFGHYAVPIDAQSSITRPLAEILRDMNKRVPDKVLKFKMDEEGHELKYIPWYVLNSARVWISFIVCIPVMRALLACCSPSVWSSHGMKFFGF